MRAWWARSTICWRSRRVGRAMAAFLWEGTRTRVKSELVRRPDADSTILEGVARHIAWRRHAQLIWPPGYVRVFAMISLLPGRLDGLRGHRRLRFGAGVAVRSHPGVEAMTQARRHDTGKFHVVDPADGWGRCGALIGPQPSGPRGPNARRMNTTQLRTQHLGGGCTLCRQ